MAVPVIMIHYGDSHYLAHSIAQACHVQGDAPVILLGDSHNHYYEGIQHYPISNYFGEARRLATCFRSQGLNPHQYDWQLFCFQRWLCLLEFLKAQNIESCLTFDSDVLLYESAQVIREQHHDVEITLAQEHPDSLCANGATAVINSRRILEDLKTLIFEMFDETSDLANRVKTIPGALTDMTALGLLLERFPTRIRNTYYPINGKLIDHNVLSSDGFTMENGQKMIEWHNNRPCGTLTATSKENQLIQFDAIHFHGHSKRDIKKHLCRFTLELSALYRRNIVQFYFRKALRKMRLL